jgi:hypothetical protein
MSFQRTLIPLTLFLAGLLNSLAVQAATAVTVGSGNSTLSITVNEDYYQGDAQFTVKVDNVQIGGTQTTIARKASNDSQAFNLLGNYGAGTHTVVVNFLNDAWGGTTTTDRNMYVIAMRYNGQNYPQNTASLMSNGPVSFQVGSAPSGAGATLTPGNGVVWDNSGNAWTVTSGAIIQVNGVNAAYTANVATLLWYNNTIYHSNTGGSWYSWNGSNWTQVSGDPRPSSANGAMVTPGNGSLLDGSRNVWTITAAGVVQKNGANAGYTANVVKLLWFNNTIYQTNSSGGWWSWTGSDWLQVAGDPRGTVGTGQFHVSGGKIYDPSGKLFIARGINIGTDEMSTVSTNSAAQPLTTMFPGINFVRLPTGFNSPSSYQTFINQMTANKIVVEIEYHPWPLITTNTGSALTTETNWYASVAAMYKNNPYVWFGTMNEPQNGYGADEANLTAGQLATYNAIRGAGNNSIILLEAGVGGGNPQTVGAGSGLTVSSYAKMANVVWDLHFYGWVANGSTDQNTVNNALLGSASGHSGITAAQTIPSADGTIPVINGEFGNSTDGQNVDANGNQVISAVTTYGIAHGTSGYSAWHWDAHAPGDLLVVNGQLTAYGKQIAAAIKATAGQYP